MAFLIASKKSVCPFADIAAICPCIPARLICFAAEAFGDRRLTELPDGDLVEVGKEPLAQQRECAAR
jgi:hypothetical protein